MVGEYLGLKLNYGEVVDLGGASAVGMAWRAAAAIEMGLCEAVLCVIQAWPDPVDPQPGPPPALAAGSAPPAAPTARPRPSSTCPTATSPRTPATR